MPTLSNLLGSGNSYLTCQASLGIAATNLTATGSTQATALVLPSDFNVFTTVATSTGAILPGAVPTSNITDAYIVVNHGANSLTVYPAVGGKIGTASANTGFTVASGKTAWFLKVGSLDWAASVSA